MLNIHDVAFWVVILFRPGRLSILQRTTLHYDSEDHDLHVHHHENFKYRKTLITLSVMTSKVKVSNYSIFYRFQLVCI